MVKAAATTQWICPTCGEQVPGDWVICTQCGYDSAVKPAAALPVDRVAEAYPPQSCLRCDSAMRAMGRLNLHEGTRAWPFLLGEFGELLVNRESFEAFVCDGCGKVEFFAPRLRRSVD